MNDELISREAVLKPYQGLDDADAISVWLIRKNIEQQPSINIHQPKFIAKADGTIEPIKNCNGYPTEEYLELVHKAYLFAEICDYDVIITNNGIFEFYNSPSHRSFSFDVEPLNYNDTPSRTIIKAFEGRL